MNNEDYLRHYGILGMKWGKRSSITRISKIAKTNEKLKNKIKSNTIKVDKKQQKIDKLTNKLAKQGRYITTIGYTRAQNTGRKLSKQLAKRNKLNKQNTKITSKIQKNEALMKSKLSSLPKDQIKLGKEIVNLALKN